LLTPEIREGFFCSALSLSLNVGRCIWVRTQAGGVTVINNSLLVVQAEEKYICGREEL
jgi:hypothetical protein